MDVDIRAVLKDKIIEVQAKRAANQVAFRMTDSELAAREAHLMAALQDEEHEWNRANGANHSVAVAPNLTALVLEFLYECDGTGQETRVVAAAAQNRGYGFKPKGAARSTNMALQGLAFKNLVTQQGGLWYLTSEGRATAGNLKPTKQNGAVA
jgi:hypothetical protein